MLYTSLLEESQRLKYTIFNMSIPGKKYVVHMISLQLSFEIRNSLALGEIDPFIAIQFSAFNVCRYLLKEYYV